jgi:hypothetical protein
MRLLVFLSIFLSTTTAIAITPPTQLDDLIRGEMAAVKAYDVAIKDLKNGSERSSLMRLRDSHQAAVVKLNKYAKNLPSVKEDVKTVGPWGTFAKAWVKGATLISNNAALTALKQGEEHGVDEYKEALDDATISNDLKTEIRATMLPLQEKHILTLKEIR